MINFTKICPVEAKLPHTEGRRMDINIEGWTEITNLILASRNFANAPKITLHLGRDP